MEKKPVFRLELTPDQQRQIHDVSGHDVACLEFTLEELEQRVAPAIVAVNPAGNTPQGYTGF